ncbi:MAG TPA: xanthine dehydrogenase family protein molybdopterin-binding subunit [Kiritimatiellia bacterium]|nr:xanthine dehydrogenase family protein molybdopterin-binding subunit [Kiritimatiellia bacterium]HMO98170.1 xanthine dehydrogenase family protein molybdopterin-binding subunit [Kiritimatiellia bacterium]HMP97582.1 xanthine dehydrogenase family protein molybdopterin-binding subunit [Kiritimatiellia bacterium]
MAVLERVEYRHVGQGMVRLDGEEKVRGQALYADDVPVPDCWFGEVVRSPVPRGRLRRLVFDPAFDFSQVCVVTPEDIPGKNIVDMMGQDMPFIAYDDIQYRGEPVALVAAPTRALARAAAARIVPDIEALPAILTLSEVVDRFHRNGEGLHELAGQTIRKGDIAAGFAAADRIIEGDYWAGHQEQLYIEPQGIFAIPEKDGGVFIQGSLQCPYYIAPELIVTLNLPLEKIRVKQTAVGGAFGGKEEFPTLIAGYCALLALKCGKPVKIIYDRHQDILYTTKRHPVWTRQRTGVKNDGTITAMEVDFVLDGGAYTTLSPVVMYRGILHTTLGYKCPHVYVNGKVYRTNTFPNGAFRGFGAPQAIWGLESHMDEVASALGMTPEAFRLHNALHEGDTTGTGQTIFEPMGTPDVLEKTLARSGFSEKLGKASRGTPRDGKYYGIGLCFFGHGSGFTGDGESRLKAKAALDLEYFENGKVGVNIRISSTEMGQGTMTIMPQIGADGLRVHVDHVRCPFPDTKYAPDSGPTVASRTAMVVGGTVFGAAEKMRRQLEAFASESLFGGERVELDDNRFTGAVTGATRTFQEVGAAYLKQHGPLRVMNQFKLPDTLRWNQKTFEGDAYPSYSWGCNVAEIEIDALTLEIAVKKVTGYYDIGRVINPVLAHGQIEGGLIQALGYAVMEKMEIKDGLYDASRMQTYVVPTALDIPEFDLHFVEYPYSHTAPGAKGVGEVPMDGLAPAVANAVKSALGIRINTLPITPEKLFAAMTAARRTGEAAA